MLGIDPKAARITWTVALTLLLLAAVYAIRGTLFIFVVAILFAYLIYPLVDQVSRRVSPANRGAALAATYLCVIGILVAIGVAIGTQVVAEARQLIENPPDVQDFLVRLRRSYPSLTPMLNAARQRLPQQLGGIAAVAPRYGLNVLAASTNLIFLVIIPIITFLILKDAASLRNSFLGMLPSDASRQRARRAIDAIHDLLLSYMRAQLFLCCTVLTVYGIVLATLGVPYALLLAAIAFFCEFVPVVGPLSAISIIVAVTAITGYSHLWWILAFLGGFRLIQDYVISPRLMGQGVEVHPLWIIFGVFAGDQIGGIAGVFLSVPTIALIHLLISKTGKKVP